MLTRVIGLVVFIVLFSAGALPGQETGTTSRRAARFYQRALDHYNQRDFERALHFTQLAYNADEDFIKAYLFAGDISLETDDDLAAVKYFEKAVSLQPDYYPPAHYILGNLYFKTGQYNRALERFTYYLDFKLPAQEKNIVQRRRKEAEVASGLKSNPVPYNPVNLCNNINTANHEYVNAISADGSMLIFTVRSPLGGNNMQRFFREEFFVSYLKDGHWSQARPMPFVSGDSKSEGALALSFDDRTIFFTSCHRPDGYGSCDIYYSTRQGDKWSDPVNLGPAVNSPRWESQPSLSPDGRTLYFASNRSGGVGGSDIWKAELQDDGTWCLLQNLGEVINTRGDEMSPYIHADGQTLYFSSTGHPGLGGADLFMSRMHADGSWSEPVNLGYPINTHADEINLIVHPDGHSAYISSDLPEGKGGYDIYKFDLHEEIKPLPVSYVKGTVRDAQTMKPLKARIELIELEKGETVVMSNSDPVSGEFIAVLPAGLKYALNANKENFIFYSHHFALDSITGIFDPVKLDIFLKPLSAGQTGILRNVFFAHDSYRLESTSKAELNKLLDFLRNNPEVEMEISGHTDNVGSRAYNLDLSTKRAKAVYEYLVSKGVDSNRLIYKGMADKYPVDTNSTPEGRANNRRTEFKIINKKGR